jgi:hypothetical protein
VKKSTRLFVETAFRWHVPEMKGAGLKPGATKSVKTDFFTTSVAVGQTMSALTGLAWQEYVTVFTNRSSAPPAETEFIARAGRLSLPYRAPQRRRPADKLLRLVL